MQPIRDQKILACAREVGEIEQYVSIDGYHDQVGDKVRDRFTKEEGMVVGMPKCLVVRFANSRAYLIDREKLEPATVESPSENAPTIQLN